MHNLKQEVSLKSFNTFGFDVNCKGLIRIYSISDFQRFLNHSFKPFKILGGGSNILLTKNLNDYVVKNEIKGFDILEEDDYQIIVKVGAGEIWHQFVMWSLAHKLCGLENLALIPGTVGAAPMQNIGAYGVEQETAFLSLNAIQIETGESHTFSKEACHFGYRESVFKNKFKDQYFITHVTYCLLKGEQNLHTHYGAIQDVLNLKEIHKPSVVDIAEAVMDIRNSKLPNPKEIGNAGSFFKNPVISTTHYAKLKSKYPTMPNYPISSDAVKIPAAWLIEQTGFKGLIRNNIGVHKNQALVLVHYGSGDGNELLSLAKEIQNKVKTVFDIDISPEVNIW